MTRNWFYPVRKSDQAIWLTCFKNNLPVQGAALGLSEEEIAAGVADCLWLIYLLQYWQPATESLARAGTKALAAALDGDGKQMSLLPVFILPALPEGTAPVRTGALKRVMRLARKIKSLPGYNNAIGASLGIKPARRTPPDFSNLCPELKVQRSASTVRVKWNWNGYATFLDFIRLEVDRDDGKGFVMLTVDNTPGFVDTHPQPATAAQWKYRGCYGVDDKLVGTWSRESSVLVGGS